MDPITYPLRSFARAQKVSPQRLYDLIDNGEIDSVLIGSRRHVIVQSYARMVKRRLKEQAGGKLRSSNPKVRESAQPTVPHLPTRSHRSSRQSRKLSGDHVRR